MLKNTDLIFQILLLISCIIVFVNLKELLSLGLNKDDTCLSTNFGVIFYRKRDKKL